MSHGMQCLREAGEFLTARFYDATEKSGTMTYIERIVTSVCTRLC